MNQSEAQDIMDRLLMVREYIIEQPVSYQKKVCLDALYPILQACQEALAEEWKTR